MSPLPREELLVERLRNLFSTRRRDVPLGIGDDAAVVRLAGDTVVTTDVLVQGEDFLPDADPRPLGRKALAVNASDLAAMGALPLHALLALGLPREADPGWFEAFVQGFRTAASEYGVALVGGDLSASPAIFAAVTLIGRPPHGGVLTRKGARPGDALYVSGTLGAAAAGLQLLKEGFRVDAEHNVRGPSGRRVPAPRAAELGRLIRHQTTPRALVDLGRALADGSLASACIDVSDGLARDLHRLCRASGVGASIDLPSLPVDSALLKLTATIGLEPKAAALYGGEDFGLLFSVPAKRVAAVERLSGRFALRRIGSLNPTGRVVVVGDGQEMPLPDAGFDHFGR